MNISTLLSLTTQMQVQFMLVILFFQVHYIKRIKPIVPFHNDFPLYGDEQSEQRKLVHTL